MIGIYGPVVFGTFGGGVSTFDELKKTVSARWGTHEIWQDKPILEYAGASLIEVSFTMILLKPYTINPLAAITLLQETMDLALPYPLILGLIPVGRGLSLFVMTELEIEYLYFFRGGGIMGAHAHVKLKEYPNPNLINTLLQALGGNFGNQTSTSGGFDFGNTTMTTTPGTPSPDIQAATPSALTAPENPTLGINIGANPIPEVGQTNFRWDAQGNLDPSQAGAYVDSILAGMK